MNGNRHELPTHRAPHDCPVCGDQLSTIRLGCHACGTELVGDFAPCEFCSLDEQDRGVLNVFLASRGNLREVEKHLGVSYPTARLRLTKLLVRLGLAGDNDDVGMSTDQILADVAAGRLDPAEAERLLSQ